jgi:hypothetical protein
VTKITPIVKFIYRKELKMSIVRMYRKKGIEFSRMRIAFLVEIKILFDGNLDGCGCVI